MVYRHFFLDHLLEARMNKKNFSVVRNCTVICYFFFLGRNYTYIMKTYNCIVIYGVWPIISLNSNKLWNRGLENWGQGKWEMSMSIRK